MVMKKKNNVIAMLLAVLMVIAMLPMVTQEAYADKYLDFSEHVNGLKDGKIEIGTTLSVNVEKTVEAYEEMMEAYLEAGEANAVLKTYSPSNMHYFKYDSATGISSLYVSEDIANAGYKAEVWILIGSTAFYIPDIEVVENPAVPPAAEEPTTPPVVVQAANTLAVTGNNVTVKYKKLKKKNQYLDASVVFTFANEGQGQKTYTLSSVRKGKKSFKKYFKIDASTGKVTVKKKLKKGTYKMKVTVQASGDAGHKASDPQTVSIKIKVK